MTMPSRLIILLTLGSVTGCMVGPDYRRPDVEIPEQYRQSPAGQPASRAAEPAELADWWKTLNDPMLDSLIERAIVSNLEFKVAEARVREARAQRSVAAANLWPRVDVSNLYRYKGTSENAQPKQKTSTSSGFGPLTYLPGITILPGGDATSPTIMINTNGEESDDSNTFSGLR
ncbi:MAG TPA: TolC family protein, partial [Phycisphaerae bacterium]|nr:TolC family protein [Phycisphaerae bacterium]